MRIQGTVGSVFILASVLLFVVVVVFASIFMFKNNSTFSDDKKIAEIVRLQASAKVYYRRLNFYTGVCSDVGVSDAYTCNESDKAYAMEVSLENGDVYCVDSSGYSGKSIALMKKDTLCTKK